MVSTLVRPDARVVLKCALIALVIVLGALVLAVCAEGACETCSPAGLDAAGRPRQVWRAVQALFAGWLSPAAAGTLLVLPLALRRTAGSGVVAPPALLTKACSLRI